MFPKTKPYSDAFVSLCVKLSLEYFISENDIYCYHRLDLYTTISPKLDLVVLAFL